MKKAIQVGEPLIQSAMKGAEYIIEKHIYTPLAIWALADGYDATGEAELLKAAKAGAAERIIPSQCTRKFIEPAYSVIGLMKLYDLTKDETYLNAAREAGKYITERRIYEEDPISPVALYCLATKDLKFREVLESSVESFLEKGLKTSLLNSTVGKALLLFHKNIEPNERYYHEALEYGNWILSTQDSSGAYVDPKYGRLVHMNARVYCVTNMPMLTEFTGDEKYVQSGIKSAQWVMNTQLDEGSFPSSLKKKEPDLESTLWATLANFRFGYYLRTGKILGNDGY